MIEGLRVAPAYYDARAAKRVPPAPYANCEECKTNVPAIARQYIGCAYEPPVEGATPWSPPAWADRGIKTTTCAGYTTSLPAVGEVLDAYPHFEAGTLTDYLDGDAPTRPALDALACLKAGIREHEAAVTKAAMQKKGGG